MTQIKIRFYITTFLSLCVIFGITYKVYIKQKRDRERFRIMLNEVDESIRDHRDEVTIKTLKTLLKDQCE